MKKSYFKLLSVFMLLTTFALMTQSGAGPKSNPAMAAYINQKLSSRNYTVEVNQIHPSSGDSEYLSAVRSIVVKGDMVESHLPYRGQSGMGVAYGGGDGLIFTSEITDYTMTVNKKGDFVIKFKCKSKTDNHTVTINVSANDGISYLTVYSSNLQPVSFSGALSNK